MGEANGDIINILYSTDLSVELVHRDRHRDQGCPKMRKMISGREGEREREREREMPAQALGHPKYIDPL